MSKSLGNSPDPLDLIGRYGADGLRFGIISIAPQGQDIRFAEERIEFGEEFLQQALECLPLPRDERARRRQRLAQRDRPAAGSGQI